MSIENKIATKTVERQVFVTSDGTEFEEIWRAKMHEGRLVKEKRLENARIKLEKGAKKKLDGIRMIREDPFLVEHVERTFIIWDKEFYSLVETVKMTSFLDSNQIKMNDHLFQLCPVYAKVVSKLLDSHVIACKEGNIEKGINFEAFKSIINKF